MNRALRSWLVVGVALVGFNLGYLFLPMRWWREGEMSLLVPLTMAVSTALSVASGRWSALRVPAVGGWLLWCALLARFLLWISSWNTKLGDAAAIWTLTVVVEVALVLAPSIASERAPRRAQ